MTAPRDPLELEPLRHALAPPVPDDGVRPVEPLFSPSRGAVAKAQLTGFASFVARSIGRELESAQALHAFSVDDARAFWALFLQWSQLATDGSAEPVRVGDEVET